MRRLGLYALDRAVVACPDRSRRLVNDQSRDSADQRGREAAVDHVATGMIRIAWVSTAEAVAGSDAMIEMRQSRAWCGRLLR